MAAKQLRVAKLPDVVDLGADLDELPAGAAPHAAHAGDLETRLLDHRAHLVAVDARARRGIEGEPVQRDERGDRRADDDGGRAVGVEVELFVVFVLAAEAAPAAGSQRDEKQKGGGTTADRHHGYLNPGKRLTCCGEATDHR
ncbi:MAG: hypothetical protein H0X44_08390 [Acidobacteria bacterium]|nr:hypothetical protein [Acidobacteriota bacterium]